MQEYSALQRAVAEFIGTGLLVFIGAGSVPAILLLDIEMPNLNGYDLLNILHTQPGIADCKTILLTSRSSDRHRQRAMELGAYAFLAKPCPEDVLLDTVWRALGSQKDTKDRCLLIEEL